MCSEYIPYDEVIFQGLSFTDETGTLFKWNGELFRGISSKRASFCRYLFNKGIIQELIAKKLFVETEITPLKLDHYEIVLKHHTIPFVSYPQEWCDMMLRDAALHQLDFCLELDEYNLKSVDAHPLNILFDGCHPVFVDFGSIHPNPADGSYLVWARYEQFCSVFIRPLRLMAQGHGHIAHWLLHDYEQGILKSEFEVLAHRPLSGMTLTNNLTNWLKSSARFHFPSTIRTVINKVNTLRRRQAPESIGLQQSRRAFLMQIRQEVESIELPPAKPKVFDGSDSSFPSLLPSDNWASSHRIVSTVLSNLRPSSVLDIGQDIHGGDNSQLAVHYGSQVVAVNPDETNVRNLYVVAKRDNLPIIPLKINFFSPSYDLSNYWFRPASERLRCDLVIALDLIDHLIKENLRFDLIVERLSTLSNRWLLVDFTPSNDRERPETRAIQDSGYTIDSLMDELMKRFRNVNIISSQSESHVLLLCEK